MISSPDLFWRNALNAMVANPVRLIVTRKRRRSRPGQSLPSRHEAIAACAGLRLIWIKPQ
jgi:hypothetical protein